MAKGRFIFCIVASFIYLSVSCRGDSEGKRINGNSRVDEMWGRPRATSYESVDTTEVRIVEDKKASTSACDGVGVGTARVNPYYDAGYEAGYEAGYDDGVDNWRHESYDDGCRYRKWKRKEYQLGYEEGYETGFDDGYADSGGDPDMEE